MKNLTWQNPEQLFVAQELINKVKSKCCGIKDKEKRVQLLIDKGLMNVTYIGCHPCTNTCSLKIKMEDILTVWLPATGHDDMKVIE